MYLALHTSARCMREQCLLIYISTLLDQSKFQPSIAAPSQTVASQIPPMGHNRNSDPEMFGLGYTIQKHL